MAYVEQDYGARRRRPRRDEYEEETYRGRDAIRSEGKYRPSYRADERHSRDHDAYDRRSPRRSRDIRRSGGISRAPPRRSAPAEPNKVLGVFGLQSHVAERDLYDVFSAYGRVADVKMVYDRETGRSRGFGFVYYEHLEDARHAKTSCEGGLEIDGQTARVDYSTTDRPHDPTPGVYMGKKSYPERRRDRSFDRPTRNGRHDEIGSNGRGYARFSRKNMSPRGFRDRSPIRGRGPMRSRKRTMSSSRSRSPPVFSADRARPSRSPIKQRRPEGVNGIKGMPVNLDSNDGWSH